MTKENQPDANSRKPLRVLMVEDSEDDALLEIRALKNGGYDPEYERVETAEAMRTALREKTWDIIVCDYQMPKFNGLASIALLKETGIDIPMIIVSGAIGEETAVACMKAGANDYIMKGNLPRLVPAIGRELKETESRRKRKLAEESLKESEGQYRNLFENANEAIFVVQDGKLVFLNQMTTQTIGYSAEELIARPFIEFIHPDDQGMVIDRHVRRMKGEEVPRSYSFRVVHRDGKIRWAEANAVLINWHGKAAALIFISDITERKQAEEALRESERSLKKAQQIGCLGSWEWDIAGGRLTWSDELYRIWGVAKDFALTQDNITALIHPDDRAENAAKLAEMLESGADMQFEFRIVRPDGATRTLLQIVEVSRDTAGKAVRIVGIMQDITERKKAEEALRESEQRFMDVLYSSPDAVLLIDGDKFVDCNEATARMLGYSSRNEFLQPHPSELSLPTQPDGRNSFEKANEMMRIASERGFHQFEWEHRRADGEDFPVEVSLTSIVLHGKNVIHCMWRDITERKRNEVLLKQTLENLRKAVDATIQVMVHAVEVRDPYTAGHQNRVADLACVLAVEMGLSQEKIQAIRMAGPIHDIGKLSIPAEILSKPSKLTNIEFALVKEHSRTGYEMLKDVESPWPLAEIVYQHHERMDGSGYPRSLKGDEILMEARVMAVADVVESMASHRPYRPALGIDAALEEIEKNRGTHYDNAVADACLRLFREKGFILQA